ncbi:MAG: alpha/beta hydrolase [Xanthobacteraceae bacterium]
MSIEDARGVYRSLAKERTPVASSVSECEVRISDGDRLLEARLYQPPCADPHSIIVFFHGGGFVIGDLATHTPFCRTLAATADMRVLSVAYRLAPEHPAPAAYEDGLAAARWALLPETQQQYGWRHMTLAGDSAGANIAAWTAITLRDHEELRSSALLLIYPNVAFDIQTASRSRYGDGYLLSIDDIRYFSRLFLNGSPDPSLLDVHLEGLPRTIVVTAGYDPLYDEGQMLARRLRDASVDTQILNFDTLIHGFINLAHLSKDAASAITEIAERTKAMLQGLDRALSK